MTEVKINSHLKGVLHGTTAARYVAIFLHGGCFQDGDETWNGEQCSSIAAATQGILLTLNFRQASRAETMEDCRTAIEYLRLAYPSLPVGIYGGSSGGYYALEVGWAEPGLAFCVALCPVANPRQRFEYLCEIKVLSVAVRAEMAAKQLRHFQSVNAMTPAHLPLIPTLVVAGDQDRNVPLTQLTPYQPHVIIGAGHELASKPNVSVTGAVTQFLREVLA